ncbi:MAG: succinate dehydrogenase, cytochrome b556 subunit [Gammaproteobacteria bacterium]|nr:succinate dehydrogenase, cytochrome b556 subunit [Gammaproteobacteria bacterium]MCZ6798065.1 succinate dehydrogenase, cytochrome b556 subunit [Gammaproteobacteria bacterium]MCZ6883504.1 succinate dehydrogenase, cytochrome b556 subunit [Gammaproteobacteria bacterium]
MTAHSKLPLSPHLQIYRLPLTALLSVIHRATGVVLGLGCLILVWVLAAAANGPEAFEPVFQHLASWYGQLFLFGMTFSLYLHFCNGIRHLFWDVGMGFELETVDKTAKLVFVAAIALTIATWLVAIFVE